MKIPSIPSGPCVRHLAIAALAMFAAVAASVPIRAEPPAATAQAKSGETARRELESLRAEQKQAVDREAKLRKEVEALGEDRRKLNDALIGTAARIRGDEEKIGATETRLKALEGNERELRKSLEGRRAIIVEILAALQRMGHRPPPALLVSPEDALLSVHTAM